MEDLRGEFTPDSESEFRGDTVFKIAAAIIVLLAFGALGAYYLGMGMLQNQPTRIALAAPTVPMKPIIQPKVVAPITAPSSSASNVAPSTDTAAVAPVKGPLAQNVGMHVRKRATQQRADLQPAPAAAVDASPAVTPPATSLTADPVSTEPTSAPAAPAQPTTQP